ncbi:lipopolysaccharide biosynthesis protein [Cryobacterium sp. PAMC25264]|nr:lipopolysaccharide biosynthesis protein [Cryobacterium sp. PAMC25264]
MKLVLQIANLVVLSRILSPRDFGLVAMVTALIGVGDVIRDLGLSSAAMQARTLSRHQKSNLFWINLGLGAFLAVATFSVAQPISAFYGKPELVAITSWLALTFLLNGFQTQFQAELGRNLRFFSLAWTELLALVLGFAGAVSAALLGYGFWALVVQQLVQCFFMTLLRVASASWWPGLPRRHANMGGLLRYGGNLTGTQVLVYASSNIDSVIVGAAFGSTTLGLYNRAFQLLSAPLNQFFSPITHVALPVLSKLQDSASEFMAYVVRAQLVLGHSVAFIFAAVIVAAEPLIRIVLGDQWTASSPILQILAIGGAVQAVSYPAYWVFLARGLTGAHLRFSLISRPVVIAMIALGSIFGVEGVAAGYAAGMCITWPLSLWWLSRQGVSDVKLLLFTGLRVLAAGALAGSATGILVHLIHPSSSVAHIVLTAVFLFASYSILILVSRKLRSDLRAMVLVLMLLRGRKAIGQETQPPAGTMRGRGRSASMWRLASRSRRKANRE